MNFRIRFAEYLLNAGEFLKTLPVAILRSSDMGEWQRVRYDRNSTAWNLHNDPGAGLTKDEQILFQHLPEKLNRTQSNGHNRLLVLGGGGGREAIFFSHLGWKVTILDISAGMLEEGKKTALASGYKIDCVQGDLAEISPQLQSFDLIWTSMFLYSVVLGNKRRIEMLKKLRKLLAPDGYLVVSFQFDPRFQTSQKADWLRKSIAYLSFGNTGYQRGDSLIGTLEFRHCFTNEEELQTEFKEASFKMDYFTICDGIGRGGAVLSKG